MHQLFSPLRYFIKPASYIIDNKIYRLHYKFSFTFLLGFSIMVTARQHFGDPISCISRDDLPIQFLNNYCWIHTTFSIETSWLKQVGSEIPYPGVDQSDIGGEKRVYHAYYQWVCFVLFFQALLFYFPRYLWKTIEGGKIKQLILGLNSPVMKLAKRNKNRTKLVQYFTRSFGSHGKKFTFFVITEILNFINVIFQMWFINKFLGGEFTRYGLELLQFTEWDWSVRYDPMIRIFPRLTKCTFYRYGSSGDVQRNDAMCILSINIINEKIYVFLWFWFYLLAILSFISIIYRIFTIVSIKIRFWTTKLTCRIADRKIFLNLLNKLPVSDWFILDLLAKNLDPLNFWDLVVDLDNVLPSVTN